MTQLEFPLPREEFEDVYQQENRTLITPSPFAIPRRVFCEFANSDTISRLRFEYASAEDSFVDVPLDDTRNPCVRMNVGFYSGRVNEMVFDPPLGLDQVDALLARFRSKQLNLELPVSHRLGFHMMAVILENFIVKELQKAHCAQAN